ncbi:hypothetical protein P8452_02505 [Trifolium repens]|nr:hypothetical protein P8452_02505 [Trifolium repens]
MCLKLYMKNQQEPLLFLSFYGGSDFVKSRFIGFCRFEIGTNTYSFIFLGSGFIGFLFMEAPFWVCAMNFWVLL